MMVQTDCQVEELAHTSEIGLRVRADSLNALFGCLARAMISMTGVQEDGAADPLVLEVDAEGVDAESLLVNWLNEVLYLHEVTGLVPQTVTIHSLHRTAITGTLEGRPAGGAGDLQVKAVTYHQLAIVQEEEGWKAEVFFDI
jgi:SHS2 domain-containing protein